MKKRRGWASKAMRKVTKHIADHPVNETTQSIGIGPLDFNVKMAREFGWSPAQLNRVAKELSKIGKREGAICRRRHPEMYEDEGGLSVFVGPPVPEEPE